MCWPKKWKRMTSTPKKKWERLTRKIRRTELEKWERMTRKNRKVWLEKWGGLRRTDSAISLHSSNNYYSFVACLRKKVLLTFNTFYYHLLTLSQGFHSTLFSYAARDSNKSFFATYVLPCFQRILFFRYQFRNFEKIAWFSSKINYAHLNRGSVNLVDMVRPTDRHRRYVAVGHATSGGRWEQPSLSMDQSLPRYYPVLIYGTRKDGRLS